MDDDPFDELDLEDAVAVETLMGWDGPTCARCGVHLPRSEAREEDGRLVCRDNPRCRAP